MAKKKKYSPYRTGLKILLVIAVVIVAAFYIINFFYRKPHIKYPAFGIDIPPNYLIHGIDVSSYQHTINWQDVKAMQVKNIQIGFAFIKATEGIDKVDAQFQRNWFAAGDVQISKGAYHFFIAGKSGKAQADNFIEIVKLKSGDLPPVLDVEETYNTPPDKMQQQIKEWLDTVENYYHVKPIIYTNIGFYNKYLKEIFDEYPFWIAHYLQTDKPRIDKWTFWQHNESGRVDGIRTPVDFNVFAGDSLDFRNLLIK